MTLDEKYGRLRGILSRMGPVLVAFSGGTDSTFLARAAAEVLGSRVLAVTVVSSLMPEAEIKEAVLLARRIKVRHRSVRQRLGKAVRNNAPDRCYLCKKKIFSGLLKLARRLGFACVVDGSNTDDLADYRPGTRALRELGIRSPLREAGLGKRDIRRLSRRMGLPTWDKPALACLASRFPYGEGLTDRKLRTVERAEAALRALGLSQLRVRHHGELCRIETPAGDIPKVLKKSRRIARELRALGYIYVTVDIEGYRRGAMNETIAWKKKR